MEYVTVSEVDELMGQSWAAEDKKARAVLLANAWMGGQRLPSLDPMPQQWKQAGAEVAIEAAADRRTVRPGAAQALDRAGRCRFSEKGVSVYGQGK